MLQGFDFSLKYFVILVSNSRYNLFHDDLYTVSRLSLQTLRNSFFCFRDTNQINVCFTSSEQIQNVYFFFFNTLPSCPTKRVAMLNVDGMYMMGGKYG